jgi:predicted sulfurtransferase
LKKLFLQIILLFSLILLASSCSPPGDTTTPTSTTSNTTTSTTTTETYVLPDIPRITCEELKLQMDSSADLILIDTRDESEFNMGHLAGAINIPINVSTPEEITALEQQLAALPDNKLKVFYCS